MYETDSILENLLEKYNLPFQWIAIGLESEIQYCTDVKKMISRSNNVVVWLVKENTNIMWYDGLNRSKVAEGFEVIT